MILTPRSAGEPRRRRPCSRLSMRGQRSRPCLRIPFEPGTPGEGVDLMHEDGASTTFRRPSPSYRPILLKWRSADEGKSYNHVRRPPAPPSAGVGTATPVLHGPPQITRITIPACRAHLPRQIETGARVGYFPIPRGLPRISGGSASATSLSRPAQASLALRPAGSLNRPRRPLSQGFGVAGCPAKPLASYQIKPTTVWVEPPSTGDTRRLGALRYPG
jgi:hypothetical protein